MVKIGGSGRSVPGGFVSLPGATYVGDSKFLDLAIFLDGTYSSKVLLKFSTKKPVKIEFCEFERVVDFLEGFSHGETGQYDSSVPGSTRISVAYLESNRVALHWEDTHAVLFPLDFMLVLNVLQSTRKKMKTMILRRTEKRKLMGGDAFLESLRPWWGMIVFLLLLLVDIVMLVGIFFRPAFFWSFSGLTVFLTSWLLFLRPDWGPRLLPMAWSYLNEGLLADLSNLKSSQKNLGIVLALLVLIGFYIYFGWEFFSLVVSFFKGNLSL